MAAIGQPGVNQPELRLGKAIKRFCRSAAAYRVLDATESRGATWTSGGCGLLALALQQLMPNEAVLAVKCDGRAQHVVFRVGAFLIDADGAVRASDFLPVWCARESFRQRVELGDWDDASDTSIPHAAPDVTLIAEALRRFRIAQLLHHEQKDTL